MARVQFRQQDVICTDVELGTDSLILKNSNTNEVRTIPYKNMGIRVEIQGNCKEVKVNNVMIIYGNVAYAKVRNSCYCSGVVVKAKVRNIFIKERNIKIETIAERYKRERKNMANYYKTMANDPFFKDGGIGALKPPTRKKPSSQVIRINGDLNTFKAIDIVNIQLEIIAKGNIHSADVGNTLYVDGNIQDCLIGNTLSAKEVPIDYTGRL